MESSDGMMRNIYKVLETLLKYEDFILGEIRKDPNGNLRDFDFRASEYTLAHRVVFGALTEFIESVPDGKGFDDKCVKDNFKRMLRVLSNIIENTLIEGEEVTADVISLMSRLSRRDGSITGNFYRSISTANENNRQAVEEIEKAREMFDDNDDFNPDWEKAFKEAEVHPFFKGSVRFFFSPKKGSPDDFRKRAEVVGAMFDKDGISESMRKDHMLIRAMLGQIRKWSGLRDLYVTEKAEAQKYLKNMIVSREEIRKLFCDYFNSTGVEVEDYLNDKVKSAAMRPGERPEVNRLFHRLTTDENSSKLFDWMRERERPPKCFRIQETRCVLINIPNAWYDRVVLDTQRHTLIPAVVAENALVYDDANQKKTFDEINDFFGWSVIVKKNIPCADGKEITLKLDFNEKKKVEFSLYADSKNLAAIATHFTGATLQSDHVIVSNQLEYCDDTRKKKDEIKQEIERIGQEAGRLTLG